MHQQGLKRINAYCTCVLNSEFGKRSNHCTLLHICVPCFFLKQKFMQLKFLPRLSGTIRRLSRLCNRKSMKKKHVFGALWRFTCRMRWMYVFLHRVSLHLWSALAMINFTCLYFLFPPRGIGASWPARKCRRSMKKK